MEQLLKDWIDGNIWVAIFGLAFAGILILLLRLTLARADRKLLRQPIVFAVLNAAGVVALRFVPLYTDVRRPLAMVTLVLLLAAIGRAAVLLVLDAMLGRRLVRPIPRIVRDITQGIVYVFVLILALRAFGVEPGSILTTSALITAVIGLSLQETLGNVFAGLAIQLQRPFEVGDWIQFDSESKHIGRVVEINWRATKLVTLDEVEITVPNGALAKAAIRNYTKPTLVSRRSVLVQAPYDVPPERVRRVILDVVRGSPGVVADPAPSVVTNNFGDSGIEYWIRFYTDQFHRRDVVDSGVRDRVWYALQRAGIGIPFPHRVVHMEEISEESRERERERRVDKRDRALRRVEFLDFVPPEQHRKLAALTTTRMFAPGEVIVRQGDQTDELFIIERGEVQVVLDRSGATTTEVTRLGPGKFFGEMALMTGERRTATVRALTECELLVVGHEAFQEVLEESPGLAEHISEVLAQRNQELEDHAASVPEDRASLVPDDKSELLDRIKKFFSLE